MRLQGIAVLVAALIAPRPARTLPCSRAVALIAPRPLLGAYRPAEDTPARRAWWVWFRAQPGGPLDVPGRTIPAPLDPVLDPAGFGNGSALAQGVDGLQRVAHVYGGVLYLAQRVPGGGSWAWRHERVADTGLEWPKVDLAVASGGRTHLVFESLAGPKSSGRPGLVHAVREPIGLWRIEALPDSFVGTIFAAPAPAASPAPQPTQARGWLWALGALIMALAWRMLLLRSRRRARLLFRQEAAFIGDGVCMEVLVRSRLEGRAWRPASAGLVLFNRRATVLWAQGLRPGEAWLSHGWRVAASRPGWVEAACGPARFELAPDPGFWAWPTAESGRQLLAALRPPSNSVSLPNSGPLVRR